VLVLTWIDYRSFVGTVLLLTVPNETFSQHVGLLIAYYITLSFWAAQTLGLSLLSRNVGGQTKKSVVLAINFIFWATGNAIGTLHIPSYRPLKCPYRNIKTEQLTLLGPQVFLARDAPKYHVS
jgi:hypothetical protein